MTLSRRHLDRILAAALLSALVTPGAALAARPTYTVPKFPVPASARVQPATGGTAVAPAGTAVAPTGTIAAPTSKATVPQTGATPAPKTSTGSTSLSTPAAVVAVIAALLALGCAIWAIARLQAYEPRWTLSLRHTFAEAGFRASATWAEFSDWARLGR
jgi:hypothetical protein